MASNSLPQSERVAIYQCFHAGSSVHSPVPIRITKHCVILIVLHCHTRHDGNLVLVSEHDNGIIHLRHTPNRISSRVNLR
jgi:hypothetical protein